MLTLRTASILVQSAEDKQEYSWVGDDFPLYYPLPSGPLPTVAMTLYDSAHYDLSPPPSQLSSTNATLTNYETLLNESNAEWALLGTTPAGFGRTRLGPENRLFVLTVYHHMHCIRKLEVALMNRGDVISTFHHALHCLNYLRQGFLCAANEGLEEGDWLEGWGSEDWELLGFEEQPEFRGGEEGFRQGKIRGEMVCEDWEMAYGEFDRNHERWVNWRDEWN